jgi:hypothetical protein
MGINLSGIEAKEGHKFEPLPEGLYYFAITEGVENEPKEEGKSGTHEFEVTVQTGEFFGRKFKHWFALTEKMVPYVKHFYSVLGAKDFSDLSPEKFVGKTFSAEVYIDEYNGKKNNKLQLGCYYEWDGKDGNESIPPAKKTEVKQNVVTAAKKAATLFSNAKPTPKVSDAGDPPF